MSSNGTSLDVPEKSTDAWLERSRLDGMILDAFTYGIFTLLTYQASAALWRSKHSGKWGRRLLLAYIVITFLLGSFGFAANARYTEDIWINFRGVLDREPGDLISNEFDFWYNRFAIDTNFVMVWIMNLLLLYRCFIIWNYNILVVIGMSAVYLAIVSLSIAVMVFAQKQAIFYNLNIHLSFLVMSCTFNLLFTILVTVRLWRARSQIRLALGDDHAATYTSVTATLVESASLYFVFDVIFVVAFALHSNVQNLILLENCLIQGIAQLLIILRVASGREYDTTVASTVGHSSLKFYKSGRHTTNGIITTQGPVQIELPAVRDRDFAGDRGKNSTTQTTSRTTGTTSTAQPATEDKETV